MLSVHRQFRYEVTPDDLAVVKHLAESTGFFSADEVDIAVELVSERLRNGDRSGYHFVFAQHLESAHGYACYGPIACTVGSYDLFWIVVDPSCQRTGIGKALLKETERLIRERGGRHIYIETSNRPQYAPTRTFYERCDYQCVAVLEEFYSRGDDKVIYRKKLE
jgi:GNAT superfamily N-acetyltransferase